MGKVLDFHQVDMERVREIGNEILETHHVLGDEVAAQLQKDILEEEGESENPLFIRMLGKHFVKNYNREDIIAKAYARIGEMNAEQVKLAIRRKMIEEIQLVGFEEHFDEETGLCSWRHKEFTDLRVQLDVPNYTSIHFED